MKTKRMFWWLPACLIVFITACHDDDSFVSTKGDYFTPSIPQGSLTITGENLPEGKSLLGCGYDITGAYLSDKSVRKDIIDIAKIDPDRITSIRGTIGTNGIYYAGNNAHDFLKNIMKEKEFTSLNGNNDLFFCGIFLDNSSFKNAYGYSAQYSFATEISSTQMVIRRLMTLNTRWENCLTDEFKQALENETPQRIIDLYGTHILVTVRQGCWAQYFYRSIVTDNADKKALSCIMGLRDYLSNISEPQDGTGKNFGGSVNAIFHGGDPGKLPTPNSFNLSAWNLSFTDENGTSLTDLYGKDLIPIYDVVSDTDKKQQLKESVATYIRNRQFHMLPTAPIIQITDGKCYRFFTAYEEITDQTSSCNVIGSIYTEPITGTTPVYIISTVNGDRLSLSPENGRILGYIHTEQGNATSTLYEISNGINFAYTSEYKSSYGEKEDWEPTGTRFYIPRTAFE